jgi:hypothetical protein
MKAASTNFSSLPKIIKTDYKTEYFPIKWQAVLFRNYGKVPLSRLANILDTEEKILINAADELGIKNIEYQEEWDTIGYITIIRNNWYLLNYVQLLELLNIDETRLGEVLEHEDGLILKLGGFKPFAEKVSYSVLTDSQKEQTKIIKELIEKYRVPRSAKYFDFYKEDINTFNAIANMEEIISDRIIYSYTSNFGDVLANGNFSAFSDNYLKTLSNLGINGIWIQGMLWKLTEFPLQPQISEGWKQRIENLSRLIEITSKYNIKVYLYLNEPRAMHVDFFENYPHLKGTVVGDYACLCTSRQEVKDLLYDAVKKLCISVPNLGGIISITMSENLTNCHSPSKHLIAGKKYEMCPVCINRGKGEVATEIISLMDKAIKAANSSAKLIAWNWGWSEFMGWREQEAFNAISSLPESVTLMSVSEEGMIVEKQGVENKVIDYSISNVGPSQRTEKILGAAKDSNHSIMAKIQVNNSWECSAVPFIPVFELIYEHLSKLTEKGVNGLMLSWTLGGYPSFNLSLAKEFYSNKKPDIDLWYRKMFSNSAKIVQRASQIFSQAFREFPFDLEFLYNGPHNYDCANEVIVINSEMC